MYRTDKNTVSITYLRIIIIVLKLINNQSNIVRIYLINKKTLQGSMKENIKAFCVLVLPVTVFTRTNCYGVLS